MRIFQRLGRGIKSAATASYVILTNGVDVALLSAADLGRNTDDVVLSTQNLGADGNPTPSGFDSSVPIYVQMLGFMGQFSGPGWYVSPVQFTAVQQAVTAVDLSGHPSITDVSQFWLVVQISTAGVVTYHVPRAGGAFSWSAANDRLTVAGASFASDDIFGVVIRAADRYANDPANAINTLVGNQVHLQSDDTGTDLLPGGPQTVTDAWLDIGPVRNVFGRSSSSGFFQVNIGDDEGIEFQALLLQDVTGVDEYPAQILTPLPALVEVRPHIYKLANDVDQYVPLSVVMANEIVGVQWQVRRLVDGGGVDATIDAAYALGGAG